jgi:hypothetical protein
LTTPRRTQLARDENGFVMAVVAGIMTILVGMAGLAVDTGLWYAIKRQNQSAADEAALSGAMEVAVGKDPTALANCAAWRNAFDNSVSSSTCPTSLTGVTVNNPPASGNHASDSNYVEVILAKQQTALFASVSLANVTIKNRAVAGPQLSTPACVLALANLPSLLGTNQTGITLAGSSVNVNTGNCSLDTNSTSSTSVVFNGNPTLMSYTIVTSGDYSAGGATVTLQKAASTHAAATTDPYASTTHPMPPSCVPNTNITNPALLTNNGCYNNISITGGGSIPSGTYFIQGTGTKQSAFLSISGTGTVTGTGVTFVLFKGADVNISGDVTLSAPTSGPWQGILFWQDKDTTPDCGTGSFCDSFTGGSTSSLTGALYFPGGNVDFSGNSGSTCTVLIANNVEFHGTPTMSASGCIAAGVTPPTNASGAIVLVE